MMAAVVGKTKREIDLLWDTLPVKLKSMLYRPERQLILSSDKIPLLPVYPSRIKSLPKYYLFNDIFVVVQGVTLLEYPLQWLWIQHIIAMDSLQQSSQNMTAFRLILPESYFDLQCKEFIHKTIWISSIVDAVCHQLQISQFISGRGDLTLDTKLQLLKRREFMQYTFHTLPEMKDVRYKGQWSNAKPHGNGEFWHEPSGKLFKGSFKKGKFHGKGELLWFADSEYRKKYIGDFYNGMMDGQGEMKYSNGDVYDGHWVKDKREGFGILEEASKKNSTYCGGWYNDKQSGYGVYDDRMKHERYLGMWSEGQRSGPGLVVTSTGTYCEAIFSNGTIAAGNDGLILDPNGSSFMGKLGPDFKLAGKGILTLNNGMTIDGQFGGSWHTSIDIQKASLVNSLRKGGSSSVVESWKTSISELQIAKLDRRIGTCTVLASNKWQSLYDECEKMLGFSGNAASDVLTAWGRIAAGTFGGLTQSPSHSHNVSPGTLRRATSLNTVAKSVRTPGELISLERARALTFNDTDNEQSPILQPIRHRTMDDLEASLMQMSIEHSIRMNSGKKIKISGPLHLQDEIACSYPPAVSGLTYSPHADSSPPPSSLPISTHLSSLSEEQSSDEGQEAEEEKKLPLRDSSDKFDTETAIQSYIDQAFNTPSHPLGILMNHLEIVFRDSYSGIGANKFLLSHAISEVQYIIKRLHSIVRILFPFLDGNDRDITAVGLTRLGDADPDDYLVIDSGYTLLHPLVFQRVFPSLKMLYILHHINDDKEYGRGSEFLSQMDNERLLHFIHFPQTIFKKVLDEEDNTALKELGQAAMVLQRMNTLYTPGEFLDLFRLAFQQLSNIQQLSCDVLLPSVVFIVVKAGLPHLGAYLHYLTDFAHTEPADEYTLVTYEAAYNFIRRQGVLT